MDLFGMIPDNFFSLLSSKNKRIYRSEERRVGKECM